MIEGDWVLAETHAAFQNSLVKSQEAVEHVAEWLRSRGNEVLVMPYTIAPSSAEWAQHSDAGDMRIVTPSGVKLVGETKELRKWPFTADEGHPFPNRVFIESVAKHHRKSPPPDWYFLLSACWQTVVAVDCRKQDSWGQCPVTDPDSGKRKQTYYTRLSECETYDLR